jgi:hypothetical protein
LFMDNDQGTHAVPSSHCTPQALLRVSGSLLRLADMVSPLCNWHATTLCE